MARFDLEAFVRAAENLDFDAWVACYAPDAQWWEYRHANPPRSPHVMAGASAIFEPPDGLITRQTDVEAWD